MQKQQVIAAGDRFLDKQELELIAATKKGDRHAFQQLYERHSGRVYALCYRITADQGLAEDATQEVFIQVWRKIGDFRAQSKFSTWLHSVAVNSTLAYMRKQKGWVSRFISLEDDAVPEQSTEMSTDNLNLDRYIARLPERARIVFVLRAVEGYRHEEIASKLNMAVGTSKSQFYRAKSLLQGWLES
ncbi:MAG: sigma-70 family RNA polymerase sigma factor [Gammaproteobacteria bacterium]|nr:sigma-70 family RNA polymerase sigma factor [Gammaproteobacteria bacterium]